MILCNAEDRGLNITPCEIRQPSAGYLFVKRLYNFNKMKKMQMSKAKAECASLTVRNTT